MALGLVSLAVFYNSFGNSFHYDDGHSLVDNPHIRSLKNIPRFFVDPGSFSVMPQARMYRPMLLTSYALNYAVHGYQVWGYHLVNLLLHVLNGWLVWAVARRLGLAPGRAWASALLFVVHPMVSEPVNYISSRSSLLAALFVLAGFWLLLRPRPSRVNALTAALCQAGALGAKAIGIGMSLGVMLYWGRDALRPVWSRLGPTLAVCAVYLVVTGALVRKAFFLPVRPLAVQWATQIKAGLFYLWKTVMPVNQSVEPQFKAVEGAGEWPLWLAGLALCSVLLLTWHLSRRLRIFAFGLSWFAVMLLPSALVPLHVLVNEHRLYLPLAGMCWAALSLPWPPKAGLLLLLLLALLTGQRNRVWHNEQSLWADAVAKGPQMARPHINLGKAYLEQGSFAQAIASSQQGLALNPRLALAHYNIGTAYLHLGQPQRAIASLERAVEIQPDLVEALTNLANAHLEQDQPAKALPIIRRALTLVPRGALWHNLGAAHLKDGNLDSARAAFVRALDADSTNREAYLGLIKASDPSQRLAAINKALRLWPQDRVLFQMLGDQLAFAGKSQEAEAAYRKAGADSSQVNLWLGQAARRRGDWAVAKKYFEYGITQVNATAAQYNSLGEIYIQEKRYDEALELFKKAARLDGQYATAFGNIGAVYLKLGVPIQAAAALERAVTLAPKQGLYWAGLAEARIALGQNEQALAAGRTALESGRLDSMLVKRLKRQLAEISHFEKKR